MDEMIVFSSVLTGIVIALVQVVKMAMSVPKNYVPLVGMLVGILVGIAAYPFTDLSLDIRVWAGMYAGLSATGLFEAAFNKR